MSQDLSPINTMDTADLLLIGQVERLIARCKCEKLADGAVPADSTLRREILEMKGRLAFATRERARLESMYGS